MASVLIPAAIIAGSIGAAACFFIAFWRPIGRRILEYFNQFQNDLDVANLHVKPDQLVSAAVVISLIGWIAVVLAGAQPLTSALALPLILAIVLIAMRIYILHRKSTRIEAFQRQLEIVLRGLTSGLKAGLGLQQALVYVTDESGEPAHTELSRVVGATNLGVSVLDAFDQLAERIGTHEVLMLARVVRVQSKSGGDLGAVLDRLAETIRARRQFDRKVRALTSEARATAWVLGSLPLVLAAFTLTTQPAMRFATLHTSFGLGALSLGLALDALAVIVLLRIMRLDV